MKDIVSFDVTEDVIAEAQAIRAQRDLKYGNIFKEKGSDLRWVGEVGEIIVNKALIMCRPEATDWLTEDVTNRGDFSFCGLEVEVKTVKRQVPMRPYYKAQITAKHADKKVDHILFTCYEVPAKKLHLLGVMTREEFLEKAEYFKAGDKVHESYTIRDGHEIYAVTVSEMTPVRDFLKIAMRNHRNKAA